MEGEWRSLSFTLGFFENVPVSGRESSVELCSIVVHVAHLVFHWLISFASGIISTKCHTAAQNH